MQVHLAWNRLILVVWQSVPRIGTDRHRPFGHCVCVSPNTHPVRSAGRPPSSKSVPLSKASECYSMAVENLVVDGLVTVVSQHTHAKPRTGQSITTKIYQRREHGAAFL
eukprot:GHVT01102563.1.p2 GENE.GHVT01102563.1~~GHVT01102563.1.p2  ORF type:complete len:109 (+),score=5.97 GHVT01102563.1:1127-1453(+)